MPAVRTSWWLLLCGALVVVALSAFGLADGLDAFEPCRVRFRANQPVRDSLPCEVHAALGIFAVIFLFIAAAAGLAAAAHWYGSRASSKRKGRGAA